MSKNSNINRPKPFFADGEKVTAAALHTAPFRKVRAALKQLDDAGIVYDLQVTSERASSSRGSWNSHHVFVVVSEQANKNWPENSLGRLASSRFFLSWHVIDAEAGAVFKSGCRFQFANRCGWDCDKRYSKVSDALRMIEIACS